MKIECKNPVIVVKRAFWLAWKACRRPFGMGFLQDNPNATEDDVWKCVCIARDYVPGSASLMGADKPDETYGDYVFGRMMKLGMKWGRDGVEIPDDPPRPDYQAWCTTYPTHEALVRAAIESLTTEDKK